ncbi:uncharacterized protein LOC106157515 [Lingula anatina]|uniref:Uncharacterized protein LOC106157515 n=1 Tax=Lingula anatina TaxID=7574 RepID=A0A1S3HSW7_LINAN|nr:uncharacterized protein LOC106157515 [Lingula anatina]|eukprot:XP_013388646.1 uncharacterized protein LOC106157515 [Lingula anatina]
MKPQFGQQISTDESKLSDTELTASNPDVLPNYSSATATVSGDENLGEETSLKTTAPSSRRNDDPATPVDQTQVSGFSLVPVESNQQLNPALTTLAPPVDETPLEEQSGSMTQWQRDIIQNNFVFLVENLRMSPLYPYLYEDAVLVESDREVLESKKSNLEKNTHFLIQILRKRGARAFASLKRALTKTGSGFIVEALEGKKSYVYGQLEVRPTTEVQGPHSDTVQRQLATAESVLQSNILNDQTRQKEVAYSLARLTTPLQVDSISQGSLIFDLKFGDLDQLDAFWQWSRGRDSPLKRHLESILLTDDIRHLVPGLRLTLDITTPMTWAEYLKGRTLLGGKFLDGCRDDFVDRGPRKDNPPSALKVAALLDSNRALPSNVPTSKDVSLWAFEDGRFDVVTKMHAFRNENKNLDELKRERIERYLQAREKQVASLQKQLDDCNQEIENNKHERIRRDGEFERLSNVLGETSGKILQKEMELNDLRQRCNRSAGAMQEKEHEIAALQSEVVKLTNALGEQTEGTTVQTLRSQLEAEMEKVEKLQQSVEEAELTTLAFEVLAEDVGKFKVTAGQRCMALELGRKTRHLEKANEQLKNATAKIKTLESEKAKLLEDLESWQKFFDDLPQYIEKQNLIVDLERLTNRLFCKSGGHQSENIKPNGAEGYGVPSKKASAADPILNEDHFETEPGLPLEQTIEQTTKAQTIPNTDQQKETPPPSVLKPITNPRTGRWSKRKTSGLDTVLCVDVSGSMQGEPFTRLKRGINQMLDDMEYANNIYEFEEDVALVTFGGEIAATVVPLTTDYYQIRRALENIQPQGMSPLVPGILEAQREIQRNSGQLVVSGRKVSARILVFTDGHPSDENDVGAEDVPFGSTTAKYKTATALQMYADDTDRHNKAATTFIACGGKIDTNFLTSVVKIGNGVLLSADDDVTWRKLGGYYKRKVWVCRFAAPFKGTDDMKRLVGQDVKTFEYWMKATKGAEIMEADMSEFDMKEMFNMILELQENDKDDDSRESDPEVQVHLPIGTRVRRGPDWKWEDQDGGGPGTVVGYGKRKWVLVNWDANSQTRNYRFGEEDKYDIFQVNEPRKLKADELIAVGVKVVRGPDWKWQDQDGGKGNVGVVFRVQENGLVNVMWPTRQGYDYRYGFDGCFDLEIVDEETTPNSTPNTAEGATGIQFKEGEHVVWQWLRNMEWVMYPSDVNMRLEHAYQDNIRGTVEVDVMGVR